MSDNIVVFDLETQQDIKSVGGNDFLEKLGLAVAVSYHVAERRFRHFNGSQAGELVEILRAADLIVGYNIRRFDFRVLSAYTDVPLDTLPVCDLLEHIEASLGHRLKLDSLAYHTLGVRKSASGTLALKWWREGRTDLICDYCQQDVDLTRRLWEYGRAHGRVWYWDYKRRQRRAAIVRW